MAIILGNNLIAGSSCGTEAYAQKYTASVSADIATFDWYAMSSANIKYGLYDASGNIITSGTALGSAGLNSTDLSAPVSIVSGNEYWILAVVDAGGGMAFAPGGSDSYYQFFWNYSNYTYQSYVDFSAWTQFVPSYNFSFAFSSAEAPEEKPYKVYAGDSHTDVTTGTYVNQILENVDGTWDYSVVGVSGNTTDDVISQWAANVTPLTLSTTYINTFSLMIGINDFSLGRTATYVTDRIATIMGMADTKGFERKVLMTIMPATSITGGNETSRLTANTWIRNNEATYGYICCDVASIPALADPSDTVYYADGLHLTITGGTQVSALFSDTLRALSRVAGSSLVATSTSYAVTGSHLVGKYTAPVDTVVYSFVLHSNGTGNVKVNIYADSGGAPGSVISAVDTSTPVVFGWNVIDLATPVSISAGDVLWLGAITDTGDCITYYGLSDGIYRNRSITYSSFTASDPTAYSGDTTGAAIKYYLLGMNDPIIDETDLSAIQDTTSLVVSGRGFLATQGTGSIVLANNAVLASATITETQTPTLWSEELLGFDVSQGSLAVGTVYLFAENDLGNITNGIPLTLSESDGSVPVSIAGDIGLSLSSSFEIETDLIPTSVSITGDIGLSLSSSFEIQADVATYYVDLGGAIGCYGSTVTSAGIKAFLDANPTAGSGFSATSGTYDLYEFSTNIIIYENAIWTMEKEFVQVVGTLAVLGSVKIGSQDASGNSENGGGFSVDTAWGNFAVSGSFEAYGSHIYSLDGIRLNSGSFIAVDCDLELEDAVETQFGDNFSVVLDRSRIHHTGAVGVKAYQINGTGTFSLNGTKIESCTYAYQTAEFPDVVIYDAEIDTCTYHVVPNISASNTRFVNPDFTELRLAQAGYGVIHSIEFRYGLTIKDLAGSLVSGVSVRLTDETGDHRFDTVTDTNGNPAVFPEGTFLNSTYLTYDRTTRAAHTLRVRGASYGWSDYARVADADLTGDLVPVFDDALYVQSDGTSSAHTGITVTDHAGSPVSWNSKLWGITVTGDLATNPALSATDIYHYLKYHCSYTAAFNGKSGMDWHHMVDSYSTTVRSTSGYYSGTIKGVRVVDENGDVFPGFSNMQADDGTYYYPPATVTVAVYVKDSQTDVFLENARVYLVADAGGALAEGTVILNALTGVGGLVQDAGFTYTSDQPVRGWIRKASESPYFKSQNISGSITSGGFSTTASMIRD